MTGSTRCLARARPAAVLGQGQPLTLDVMALSGPATRTLPFGVKRPQNVAAFYITLAVDQPQTACSRVLNRFSL